VSGGRHVRPPDRAPARVEHCDGPGAQGRGRHAPVAQGEHAQRAVAPAGDVRGARAEGEMLRRGGGGEQVRRPAVRARVEHREPALARRYAVESYGTVVLETKTKSEKVLDAEEEKLTNGLVKVTREGKRAIYIVQGHGEHEITNTERSGFSEAKGALERSNYEVKPLVLAREAKVPDDAAVVIEAGPRTDLFAPELDALDAYLGL